MGEDLYELPKGWVWTQLGNIANFKNGINFQSYQKGEEGILTIDVLNMYSRSLLINTENLYRVNINLKDEYVLKYGDILFVRSSVKREGVGWASLFKPIKEDVTFCGFIIRARLNTSNIFPELITYFLRSSLAREKIVARSSQVTITNISQDVLRDLDIPLPPLPEQHRIVAKIEELFTQLDAGVELLKKVKAKLKRYRQAVLKAAMEGNLTKEWRIAHQGELEPASVLLERILKQRREKWEAEQLAKMQAQGKTPKDDTWKLKYKEAIAPDTSDLPELPDGWCWISFGQAFNVHVGATPSRKRLDFWGGTIPWVSSGEVAFCHINKTDETITNLGLENSSTDIHPPGTVLLGMIGEGKTRGQAAILDIAASHNQNSAAIRVSEVGMPPEYIYYFLESEYERTRQLGSGNNQPALNKTRVQMMIFPCPSLKEQNKIVEEFELIFSVADQLKKTINANIKRAERLRQSILKQAFTGQLVPQDPNDEPAEKLLERIQAEKAKQVTTKTKKKTKSQPQSPTQLALPLD